MPGVLGQEPAGETPAGHAPFQVHRPVMLQRWLTLTFLHWRYDPASVQKLLPPGLTVETFDGSAWVGLVPFYMQVATPGGASAPWASNFCETNVRTYVRDREGRSGLWFLSLDAARLGAVVLARTTYRLPYFWSRMRLTRAGDQVSYICERRWPGPRRVSSEVRVEVGASMQPEDLTELDQFLTARWVLFSVMRSRSRFARAHHDPWPLRRARLRHLDDQLVATAGLPPPRGKALVHYSDGVAVRIGRPERYH